MSEQSYTIEFPGATEKEANQYAEALGETLANANPDLKVKQKRSKEGTQDFGGTLIIILGTQAAVALAKALGDWLKLHHSVEITIKTKDGTLVGRNLTVKDAHRVTKMFKPKTKSGPT